MTGTINIIGIMNIHYCCRRNFGQFLLKDGLDTCFFGV